MNFKEWIVKEEEDMEVDPDVYFNPGTAPTGQIAQMALEKIQKHGVGAQMQQMYADKLGMPSQQVNSDNIATQPSMYPHGATVQIVVPIGKNETSEIRSAVEQANGNEHIVQLLKDKQVVPDPSAQLISKNEKKAIYAITYPLSMAAKMAHRMDRRYQLPGIGYGIRPSTVRQTLATR